MTSIHTIRIRLSYLWFSLSALLFILLLVQSINDPKVAKQIWTWFTPLVLPGTGLIVGLWIAIKQKNHNEEAMNSFSASLSQGFVLFYFFCLYATVLASVFVTVTLSEWLETSQLWIGMIQAPTLAVIGKLFAEN